MRHPRQTIVAGYWCDFPAFQIEQKKIMAPFPMPDVTGLSESQATSKLHDIGLKVSVSRVPGSTGDRVVGQKPSAGSTVSAKSTVEIFIGD